MQATERKDPHPSELLQAGDSLGRYQLLCPIARGGMGQVWAARQTGRLGLPKLVAIKTAIALESKDYRQVQEYLFDEAQVASSVDHPNVCKILELGQERDVLFIAMEWLNGVPLSTLVSKLPHRRLAYRMAAYLVAQACSGLHAAHELTDDDGVHMEVVHRDATPHNFMITSTGELKVMDFGIVKSKNQQHQATQNGELKGKLSYLAPEQIRGRRVDRRADVFALGGVLYVITVGKGAFNPETDQDAGRTIHRILSGEYAPPSSILSDYPPELDAIVARALATTPEQRYQTAEEMRLDLEAFLVDGSRSVNREDVAALLGEYCGPIIEHRRSEIRNTQRLFDSQSGPMRSGAYPVAEKAVDVGTPLTLASQGVVESASDWSKSSPQPASGTDSLTHRYRGLIWAVFAGSMLLLGSLGAFTLTALQKSASSDGGHATAAKSEAMDPLRERATPPNAQPLEEPPRDPQSVAQPPLGREISPPISPVKADGVTKASRRSSLPRASTKTAPPPATTAVTGAEATAAPSAPNNSQFTQSLSRKPPRHTIDESDPFGK